MKQVKSMSHRLATPAEASPRAAFDIWRAAGVGHGCTDNREGIERLFMKFDDDETGKISFKNIKRMAQELGENIDDEMCQEVLNDADWDGDGEINIDEFYRVCSNIHGMIPFPFVAWARLRCNGRGHAELDLDWPRGSLDQDWQGLFQIVIGLGLWLPV